MKNDRIKNDTDNENESNLAECSEQYFFRTIHTMIRKMNQLIGMIISPNGVSALEIAIADSIETSQNMQFNPRSLTLFIEYIPLLHLQPLPIPRHQSDTTPIPPRPRKGQARDNLPSL